MYVCVCMGVCVRERERESEREGGREGERAREREGGRGKERLTRKQSFLGRLLFPLCFLTLYRNIGTAIPSRGSEREKCVCVRERERLY